MKRVIVDHCGGPDVLKVADNDVPQSGLGEVRVRVLAARSGLHQAAQRGASVTGVDATPEQLAIARQRVPNAVFHLGDGDSAASG
jgi:hypothetical protein